MLEDLIVVDVMFFKVYLIIFLKNNFDINKNKYCLNWINENEIDLLGIIL